MIPSLPCHPIPSPFLSSPVSSSPPSLPSLPCPLNGGPGLAPENFWNDICLQVTFSEFWVLNSMFYWTGFFVHKNFWSTDTRWWVLAHFQLLMQQYDELGFLNINLSLGTYLDDFDFDLWRLPSNISCAWCLWYALLCYEIFLAVWTGKSTSKRTRFLNQQLL